MLRSVLRNNTGGSGAIAAGTTDFEDSVDIDSLSRKKSDSWSGGSKMSGMLGCRDIEEVPYEISDPGINTETWQMNRTILQWIQDEVSHFTHKTM